MVAPQLGGPPPPPPPAQPSAARRCADDAAYHEMVPMSLITCVKCINTCPQHVSALTRDCITTVM